MTALGLRKPLFVLMLALALIGLAGLLTPRLAVDTFPELAPPVLVIGTKASGMGPQDVEKTITWRLEKAVSATPGVDHVQSISRSGLSVVYVWLKWGTDLNAAQSLVQQQVAFAMSSVPKSLGIIPPFVLQYDPANAPVVQVAVHGGDLSAAQLYDYAASTVAPRIEGIAGVASASPNGGKERQINVVVDPVKAAARGLTTTDVAAVVKRENALLPSGRITVPTFSANVYTNAVASDVSEFEDAVVKVVDGRPVLLRDVARVVDGGSKDAQAVTVDGKTAVYLNVLRVPGGNVVGIVDAVKTVIADLDDVPPGVKVVPIFDQSTFVRATLGGLQHELIQVLFLVAAVILLFLQSGRLVVIAALSVPIALATVLIALFVTGQTLNAFTLGGMTLAMGPLVDISVVVLESIHRRRHAGADPATAAREGAQAVAAPALAAMLCTLAVLSPIALLAGLAQRLFSPLAITVATGMVAGYVVSMLVTPVACRYLLGDGHKGAFATRLEHRIEHIAARYVDLLGGVLQHGRVVVAAVVVLVAVAVVGATRLPTAFFPDIDESMERVYVKLAPGTSLEDATTTIVAMGKRLADTLPPGTVELVLTNIGSPSKARSAMTSPNYGPHMGFIRLALTERGHRELDQAEIAVRMRAILDEHHPGIVLDEVEGAAHEHRHRHARGRGRITAREAQEAADDVGDAVGLVHDRGERRALSFVVDLVAQLLGTTADDARRRGQLVGDAHRQRAEGGGAVGALEASFVQALDVGNRELVREGQRPPLTTLRDRAERHHEARRGKEAQQQPDATPGFAIAQPLGGDDVADAEAAEVADVDAGEADDGDACRQPERGRLLARQHRRRVAAQQRRHQRRIGEAPAVAGLEVVVAGAQHDDRLLPRPREGGDLLDEPRDRDVDVDSLVTVVDVHVDREADVAFGGHAWCFARRPTRDPEREVVGQYGDVVAFSEALRGALQLAEPVAELVGKAAGDDDLIVGEARVFVRRLSRA